MGEHNHREIEPPIPSRHRRAEQHHLPNRPGPDHLDLKMAPHQQDTMVPPLSPPLHPVPPPLHPPRPLNHLLPRIRSPHLQRRITMGAPVPLQKRARHPLHPEPVQLLRFQLDA